jgi:hypothetical protein
VEGPIWDGSGTHRARVIRATGPAHIRLPAYAPELSPAERLFEEIRGRLPGRLYVTIDAKAEAVEQFLAELRADATRHSRLVGRDWTSNALTQLDFGHFTRRKQVCR